MSGARVMAAAVLLAAAGPALGFVRETTAVGDPGAGLCLWWGTRSVHYQVNATSAAQAHLTRPACPGCEPCHVEGSPGAGAAAAAALVAATLPEWSQACTDFAFASDGPSTQTAIGNDGVNLLVFRTGYCFDPSNAVVPAGDPCRNPNKPGACAAKYNCWEHDASGTIGLTTTTFRVVTGEIIDADVEFHGWDGGTNGYLLTCAEGSGCAASPGDWPPASACTSTDVASLALHEAGHQAGLDHTCQYAAPYASCTADSVMQPVVDTGATRRTLGADDVDGLCTIYPRGAATLTCAPPASPKSGGCATGDGAGLLALLGGALAALRAGRRRSS